MEQNINVSWQYKELMILQRKERCQPDKEEVTEKSNDKSFCCSADNKLRAGQAKSSRPSRTREKGQRWWSRKLALKRNVSEKMSSYYIFKCFPVLIWAFFIWKIEEKERKKLSVFIGWVDGNGGLSRDPHPLIGCSEQSWRRREEIAGATYNYGIHCLCSSSV